MQKIPRICRILLAGGVGLCYKPCVIMKSLLISSAFAVMLPLGQACASQPVPEDAAYAEEEAISEAATQAMEAANAAFEHLAGLLQQVVDAPSAAALLPEIEEAVRQVWAVEASAFDDEDEEMVAAAFANDVYVRVAEEVARLADAGFYGYDALRQLLDVADSTSEELPASRQVTAPAAPESPAQEASTESRLAH